MGQQKLTVENQNLEQDKNDLFKTVQKLNLELKESKELNAQIQEKFEMSEEAKANLESELLVAKQSLSDQSRDLENLQQNKLDLSSKILELTSDLENKTN